MITLSIHSHEAVVSRAKKDFPSEEELYDMTNLFKMFADFTRVRILFALLRSEMCVIDIAMLLGMEQSAISHQLRLLKQSKLVKARREGKHILYSLDDSHVEQILDCGIEHIEER